MTTIRDVMSPDPISIGPDSPITEAISMLIEHDISGLPVVEPGGAIVGVLSEKDLLKVFHDPGAPNVGALMTTDPITIAVDAPLVEVVDCLMAYDFRRVLIHEGGRLVGLVSRTDLMPIILELVASRSAPAR